MHLSKPQVRLKTMLWIGIALIVAPIFIPQATLLEKVGGVLVSRMAANADGAHRETTIGCKILKVGTGYSCLDAQRYDWKGGPNSVINNPCGTVCSSIGFNLRPPWAPKPLD